MVAYIGPAGRLYYASPGSSGGGNTFLYNQIQSHWNVRQRVTIQDMVLWNVAANSSGFQGYRDGTNTGYKAVYDSTLGRNLQLSDLTTYTGSLTFSTPNVTYYRQHITGHLTIAASNITFSQCLFDIPVGTAGNGTSYLVSPSGSPTGTQFVDSELNGGGVNGPDASPYPSGSGFAALFHTSLQASVLRCNAYGTIDIFKGQSNCYYGYSWIHGNVHYYDSAGSPTHSDHIQSDTGSKSNVTVEYNTLGTPKSVAALAGTDWTQYEPLVNSGIQLGSFKSTSTMDNYQFRYNYMNEGNYAFAGGFNGASVTNSSFNNNRVGPHQRYGAKHGGFTGPALDGTYIAWANNVYDDNFTAYWGGTYTKDQLIP